MYVVLLSLTCLALARTTFSHDVEERHMARCLATISHRYFSTGQTLVISRHEKTGDTSRKSCENFANCDGTTFDFVRSIFAEIHKPKSRGVVVWNAFTICHAEDWNSNDKHGSYLLLSSSESDQEFHIVKSIKGQLKRLSTDPGWNPRARFAVTVMKICYTCDAEKLSRRILEELWYRKVVNAIILVPPTKASLTQDVMDSRTKDRGHEMKVSILEIYTWFPYQGPNQCSKVDKAVLLDMWLMKGNGSFMRNSSLFPKKISTNLHGCELRVSTKQSMFVVGHAIQNSGNDTNITYKDGWEIRLISFIAETMKMKTTFLPPAETFRRIHDEFGNFTGYMANLMFDEADVAFAAIIRAVTSTSLTDVTTSYQQGKWEWYVPCPVKYPRWKSIFRIFSASLWLSVFLSALLANFTMVFLAKFESTEFKSFRRFVSAITDMWAIILGVSVPVMPRTTPLRLLFLSWVCFSLALNTVFQAYLTTFLIDPGLEKSITSTEEVFTSGTKYGFSPYLFDYHFNDKTDAESMKILENRVDCSNMTLCLTWTATYRNISVICANMIVDYLYNTPQFFDEYGNHQLCRIKDSTVLLTDMVMLLQKGSPLLDRVNEIIDRVLESGLFNRWIQESTESEAITKAVETSAKTLTDEFYELNLKHMQPAFYLLFFGDGLSLVSFLMELLYFKMHLQRQ
jgi:hypothetical protein